MGPIGFEEMFFIFILALVLFGPKKLPELGRTVGKALSEFRRASSDLKSSFEREMRNLERETEASKESANTIAAPAIPTDYDYTYDDSAYNGDQPYMYQPSPSTSSTVSATEPAGAESHGAEEAAQHEHPLPSVEGTVPRTEATPQHS